VIEYRSVWYALTGPTTAAIDSGPSQTVQLRVSHEVANSLVITAKMAVPLSF